MLNSQVIELNINDTNQVTSRAPREIHSNFFHYDINLNQQDGIYLVKSTEYQYRENSIKGELKNFKKTGRWIYESRLLNSKTILSRIIVDYTMDSTIIDYFKDTILEYKEVLYPKLFIVPESYYIDSSDKRKYGLELRVKKVYSYYSSGNLKSIEHRFEDGRRYGSMITYSSNGQLIREECYCNKDWIHLIDSIFFNSKICKDSLYKYSFEVYSHDGIEYGSVDDIIYNQWNDKGIQIQKWERIYDTIYSLKQTILNDNGLKQKEYLYVNSKLDRYKEVFYDSLENITNSINWYYDSIFYKMEIENLVDYFEKKYDLDSYHITEFYRKDTINQYLYKKEIEYPRDVFSKWFPESSKVYLFKKVIRYYSNGNLKSESFYYNDKNKIGSQNLYFENGKKEREQCYFLEEFIGNDSIFNNSLCKEKIYTNFPLNSNCSVSSNLVYNSWFKDGNPHYKWTRIIGDKDYKIKWTQYFNKNIIENVSFFINENLDSYKRFNYELNGKLKSKSYHNMNPYLLPKRLFD